MLFFPFLKDIKDEQKNNSLLFWEGKTIGVYFNNLRPISITYSLHRLYLLNTLLGRGWYSVWFQFRNSIINPLETEECLTTRYLFEKSLMKNILSSPILQFTHGMRKCSFGGEILSNWDGDLLINKMKSSTCEGLGKSLGVRVEDT